MKFGELTISEILLSAFSGFGILLLSWLFGQKVFRRFKKKDRQNFIIQQENDVKGNVVGGNIIESDNIDKIDVSRSKTKIVQSKNIVGGDLAGGNIVKKE